MNAKDLDFSTENDQNLPLPFVVAKKWGFPLRHVVEGEVYWYSVRDWVAGLTDSPTPLQAWQSIRTSPEMQSILPLIRRIKIPGTKGGSPSQVANDKVLYQIAAYMKITQNRPALKSIKDYLAKAGVFMDLARRDPEAAELALHQRRERKYLAQGKAPEWIAVRELGIITRKQLMAVVYYLLRTDDQMGALTNETYLGVFGMNAQALRDHVGIPKHANLRDQFSTMALVYTQAAEEACRIQLRKYDDDDVVEVDDVKAIITTLTRHIGKQVKDMAKLLGIDIVTGQPVLGTGMSNEQLVDEGKKIMKKSKLNPFSGG